MKINPKFLLPILGLTLFASASFAQVTVTNPGNTTPGLMATYPSLAAAITDLNAQTAISGPVTITLTGNETAPAGGYAIGVAVTGFNPTGISATNNVVIQGSSSTITAFTPQTSGNLNDAIFKLIGAQFITIQNFTMQENAANTTTVAGTNNMTEWGVALLYASTTLGSQNCTIQNNIISLNRTYQNTFGIYSNSTHSATSVTTSVSATGAAGGNSGMKVYGNTISNVNNGIVVVGPTAAADANTGIDIGGAGGGQANSITNFGTTGTFSGYANVSATVNGILVRNSNGFNVSFNTVTSSVGGTTTATLNGIQIPAASATPTGTFTNTINSNNISLQSGLASGAMNGIVYPSGSASTTSVLNINSNNFNTFGHTVAGTGGIVFISVQSTNLTESISSNTFTNMSVNTTGSVTFISNSYIAPAGGTKTINSNSIVTGFAKTGAGGTVNAFNDASAGDPNGVVHTNNSNNFSNITVTGATGIVGWSNTNGLSAASGPTKTITGNTFSNWTGGTASMTAMSINFGGNGTNVSNNTISNITYAPSATGTTLTGLSIGSSNSGASQTYANNTISGLSSTATGGQNIGILGGSVNVTTLNINGNSVGPISSTSTAGPVVAGIFNQNTGPTVNIFKNKVRDVSCSPGAVIGINSTGAAATNVINVYNNYVGRLYAPASAFFQAARGLLLQSTVAATYNVFYNTVYLDGTTDTQTYCVYIGSTVNNVPNVNPIDNIFVNNVTSSNGATLPATVYFRFGTTTAGDLAATANNNVLYCGTPAVDHLIYVDGAVNALTNPQQTLGAYKTFVGAREAASFSVLPPFLNTTNGALATYLHIDPTVPTLVESGGIQVTSPFTITDDYDGDIRQGNGGYTGTGTAPDVGADEGNFTAVVANDLSATAFISPTNGGGVATGVSFSPVASFTNNGTNTQTSVNVRYRICTDGTCSTTLFDDTQVIGSIASTATTQVTFASTSLSAGTYTIKATAELAGDTVPGNDEITGTINVQAPLNGTYTVGSAGAYSTLTAAVTALNSFGMNGPVIFTLLDASNTMAPENTGEVFPIVINSIAGASPINTITIKPAAGVTATLSAATTLLKLNGADYVTIDGSNNGTSSRNLTLINSDTGTASAAIWIGSASASDGATNNTVKNCIIMGNSGTTTVAAILSGSGAAFGSPADSPNSNNTIQNNQISGFQNGMFLSGAAALDANWVITGNAIGSAITAQKMGFRGMFVGNAMNFTVSNNTVAGVLSTTTSSATMTGLQVSGTINSGSITGNKFSDIKQVNTAGWGSNGIYLAASSTASNLTVANNFVWDVASQGFSTVTSADNGYGIMIDSGAGYKIYFNSVNLNTDQGANAATGVTAGINIAAAVTTTGGIDLRNNIFSSTQTLGTRYAVYDASTAGAAIFSSIDYNDYFAQNVGFLGSAQPTLANWQTATGQDANSKAVDPIFVAPTNLHLQMSSTLLGMGVTGTGITVDIDGDLRHNPPDIGADEATVSFNVTYDGNTNTGGTVPVDSNNYVSGASVTVLGNTGGLFKTGYTFTGWNTAADGSGTEYAAGATFNITSNTTLYAQWIFLHVVSRSYLFDGVNTTVTVTLNAPPNQNLNIDYATGLVPSSWTAYASNPASTTGTGTFSIMITVAGDQRPPTGSLKNMFFRASK